MPLPLPHPHPYRCAHAGEATLTLTSGDNKDPYAVCFPQFKVSVAYSAQAKKCMLTITPDAMVDNLKFGENTTANGAKVRAKACMHGWWPPAAFRWAGQLS